MSIMEIDKDTEKRIRRFVSPSVGYLFVGIVALAFGLGLGIYSVDIVYKVMWLLFGFGTMGYIVWLYFGRIIRSSQKLKAIRNTPDYPILINDFKHAGRAFHNIMILGDKFVIAKDTGKIVAYSEITRIFQVTESVNGMETQRSFYYYDINGKKRMLCQIPRAY